MDIYTAAGQFSLKSVKKNIISYADKHTEKRKSHNTHRHGPKNRKYILAANFYFYCDWPQILGENPLGRCTVAYQFSSKSIERKIISYADAHTDIWKSFEEVSCKWEIFEIPLLILSRNSDSGARPPFDRLLLA